MWQMKPIWRVFIKGMKKERAGGKVGGKGKKGRMKGGRHREETYKDIQEETHLKEP